MRKHFSLLIVITSILITLFPAKPASACSRAAPFSIDKMFVADVIVRITAVKYVMTADPNTRTTGEPESTVEFKVEEILKGEDVPEVVVLHGYLSDRDDLTILNLESGKNNLMEVGSLSA